MNTQKIVKTLGNKLGWALVGGAGLGAALMYLFDPKNGGRRRSLTRDKAGKVARQGGDKLAATARDLRNRSVGTAREATGRFKRQTPTDQVLAERVRAELGHLTTPGVVEVNAHQGCITLTGQVPSEGVDDLLKTVRRVRGVTEVDNRLMVEFDGGRAATGS